MKLFNRSPKFVYEFNDTDNFFDREVKNFNELITLLEDENFRLIQEGGSSHVTITKINVKKDIVIHSQTFSLPYEESTDFDGLCKSFLAKKPVNSDISVDVLEEKTETSSKQDLPTEVPVLEEKQEVSVSDEIASIDPDEIVKPSLEVEQVLETTISDSDDQALSEFKLNTEEVTIPLNSSDDEVSLLIEKFNQEMKSILSDFAEKEKLKISEEISQLDKRSEISKRVTDEFERLESDETAIITEGISIAKNNAIDEENRRHEEALKEIEDSFDDDLSTQLITLKASYRAKIDEAIASQYDKETEILSKIFQGKSAELSVKQKTLNQGLENRFSDSLSQFNETHQTVISQLETFQK